ncbi:MAG: threonine/serine exporter family protein [Oscillospiraceae bacterium]
MSLLMDIFTQILYTFFATCAFAIMFDIPKKELIWCGFTGTIGQTIYAILKTFNGNILIHFFVATFVVAYLSRILAIHRHTPVTVYLTTGIIPLVPGAYFYYTIYNIITQNNYDAIILAIDTFKIAGAISVGIIVVLAIPINIFNKISKHG